MEKVETLGLLFQNLMINMRVILLFFIIIPYFDKSCKPPPGILKQRSFGNHSAVFRRGIASSRLKNLGKVIGTTEPQVLGNLGEIFWGG